MPAKGRKPPIISAKQTRRSGVSSTLVKGLAKK